MSTILSSKRRAASIHCKTSCIREALTKWQQDRERDLSAQQNNPEGSSPTNEGVAEEEAADANSRGSAGRSSE
jgi:Arc/MetJ-type ribon-helix-helix transcriptional regulator